ncbi:MAG: 5'-nucleotidase C-terminal domain-containing protein [Rhodospirillales bacterium]
MATYTLQVLHASDLEGGTDAIGRAPNFAAIIDRLEDVEPHSITLSAGDNYIPGPFFNAADNQAAFRDSGVFNDVYNSLFSTTAYNGLREGGGRVDISIMNVIGFDASALGNHEFDLGTAAIREIVAPDFRSPAGPAGDRWVGAQFPYLSANLDFSADPNLADLFTPDILPNTDFVSGPAESGTVTEFKKIAPATIVERGGEMIGIVAATTPLLQSISSPGDTTVKNPGAGSNDMDALAAILQPVIDAVIGQGVNKIVLVTHLQQLVLEQTLVPKLSGVDIAIAGGSDSILANPGQPAASPELNPGDIAVAGYPVITANKDGHPAVIVSTDGQYSYVGRLVVTFDADGVLDPASIDPAVSGPHAATEAVVAALWGADDPFADGTKGALVATLVGAVSGVVADQDGNVFGETSVYLEGRRTAVRTEETNFGNLSADANLALAQTADPTVAVSIKNGGGIRAPIGETVQVAPGVYEDVPPQDNPATGKLAGQVSQLDITNTLKFNNGLTLLNVTAAQLLQVVEHGVAASGAGQTPGQFPQIGGAAFSYDLSRPAGERVVSLVITDDDGTIKDVVAADGELVGDPGRVIRIVTLNFLADGGDNYPFRAFESADQAFVDRVDLAQPAAAPRTGAADFAPDGSEQDALAEYLAANHPIGSGIPFDVADTPAALDERIQNLALRSDSVFSSAILGTEDDDVLVGTAAADVMFGGLGRDDIDGGDGDDTLLGGPGRDTLHGGDGDDVLEGGPDGDRLFGGDGDDTLVGGDGRDRLAGNKGNDLLIGGAGNDTLAGNWGDDTLLGGDGDDRLRGGQGDDLLDGGAGNDTLSGGPGDDVFVLRAGDGTDWITDFAFGEDRFGLAEGLTFDVLVCTPLGSGVTEIRVGDELLAVVQADSAAALGEADFLIL